MCPSSGLLGGVLDCDSQFTILSPPSFDGSQLWRFTSVCSSLSPHTCTLCPMFSLNTSVVGLVPPCTCWRKDTVARLCASYLCHMIGEELVFFLRVLKDLRWCIRHHSSVEESAGLNEVGLSAGPRFDSGRKPVYSNPYGFEPIDPKARVLNYCFQ